jgi:predicted membrane protein
LKEQQKRLKNKPWNNQQKQMKHKLLKIFFVDASLKIFFDDNFLNPFLIFLIVTSKIGFYSKKLNWFSKWERTRFPMTINFSKIIVNVNENAKSGISNQHEIDYKVY